MVVSDDVLMSVGGVFFLYSPASSDITPPLLPLMTDATPASLEP